MQQADTMGTEASSLKTSSTCNGLGDSRGDEGRLAHVQGRLQELTGTTTFDLECPYARTCWELLALYADIPAERFNHRHDVCYCKESCCPTPRKTRLKTGGCPQGWVRFALSVNETICEARKVFNHWHKCFHGTTLRALDSIVEISQLLKPGSELPDGTVIGTRDGHIPHAFGVQPANAPIEHNYTNMRHMCVAPNKTIFVSPSINYAAHRAYAEPVYVDRDTRMTVVLECRMCPRAYSASASTVREHVADDYVSADGMEWTTELNNVHYITGVLVKVEKLQHRVPAARVMPGRHTLATSPLVCTPEAVARHTLRSHRRSLHLLAVLDGTMPFSLKCEYAKRCWSALTTLADTHRIDPRFFNHTYSRCYCASCLPKSDKGAVFRRGDKPYQLPEGWVRIGLQVTHTHARATKLWETSHVCYHGTSIGALKPIIEGGEILPPGEVNVTHTHIIPRDDEDNPREGRLPTVYTTPAHNLDRIHKSVFVSPSVAYASSSTYAERYYWPGGRQFLVPVLQTRIRPDTYDVRSSTLRDTPHDPCYSADEMEWYTPRRGVIQIYGLLLKLHPAQ
ncbi:hypothetical protein PTSG_01796 [Salpingoeca rosetta]|uniref:Uncharacterized protein n=1 Tax=Salpingoeca rosetta (strain ATCC 50818 / BSB-021) TaxID=946362 RepID=F2TYZ7_SALR5|nr:uncharacterized protein PTSG_01796 [Salpingoeca rosetta]EGD78821.1 hypothetical protein PTSG_01796 [Salpingoeca rosetta]|eukprot:XP_004997777.1 hypothetical protein PTSG_01796 [Salpingoeca rosetta]